MVSVGDHFEDVPDQLDLSLSLKGFGVEGGSDCSLAVELPPLVE